MILLSRNRRVRADIFSRRRIDEARSSSSRQKTHCHADQLAERIVQLDGEPNFSPEGLMGNARGNAHLPISRVGPVQRIDPAIQDSKIGVSSALSGAILAVKRRL